jgi:hypothetical protein
MFALQDNRVQDASSILKEALRIHRDGGDRRLAARDLGRFARALALEGRAATAAQLLSRSVALREEIGALEAGDAEFNEQTLTMIKVQLDEAAFAEGWEQGRKLTVDEAVALALASVE